MATTTKRLDDLIDSLTPEQAFFVWMEDVISRFESSFEYGAWLNDHEQQHPDLILTRPLLIRVEASMKGDSRRETRNAVLRAFWQVALLYCLFWEIDNDIESTANEIQLYTILASKGFSSAVQQDLLSDREIPTPLPKSSTTRHFNHVAKEVLARKAALEQIQTKYFGGRKILLKSAADQLAVQLTYIEAIGELWDEKPGLIPSAKSEEDATQPPILQDLKKSIDPSLKVRALVNAAKIQALKTIGETKAASKFRKSWLEELNVSGLREVKPLAVEECTLQNLSYEDIFRRLQPLLADQDPTIRSGAFEVQRKILNDIRVMNGSGHLSQDGRPTGKKGLSPETVKHMIRELTADIAGEDVEGEEVVVEPVSPNSKSPLGLPAPRVFEPEPYDPATDPIRRIMDEAPGPDDKDMPVCKPETPNPNSQDVREREARNYLPARIHGGISPHGLRKGYVY